MSSAEASPSYSLSRFALTLERAFQYSESDTIFSKLGKFTVGTALTTTACIAAIVETTLAALLTVLTAPAYFLAPNRFAFFGRHTVNSAGTIIQAVKRSFGAGVEHAKLPGDAEVKQKTPVSPAPPAPPSIQSKKVEQLPEPSQNFASRALQFSKEHKTLMIAIALGTATLAATAFYFYYMKTTSPSNLPIPILFKSSADNPFLETCPLGENISTFSSVGTSLEGASTPQPSSLPVSSIDSNTTTSTETALAIIRNTPKQRQTLTVSTCPVRSLLNSTVAQASSVARVRLAEVNNFPRDTQICERTQQIVANSNTWTNNAIAASFLLFCTGVAMGVCIGFGVQNSQAPENNQK